MFVVLVGLRFGVAPFLWRSEDCAPADEAVLESVDCARGTVLRRTFFYFRYFAFGGCLYLPQENCESYSTGLERG